MADSTWTTANEALTLSSDYYDRSVLEGFSQAQSQMGLVSWGGYVFHVYKEIAEKHSVEFSEYPVPGNSTVGYRVQNKINMPSEVVLDALMVTTGALSNKTAFSAPFMSINWADISSYLDVTPWVTYPLSVGGIIDKLKEAMYKGWALTYNGKYGRIKNMAIRELSMLDNEKTAYGVPVKIVLRQVLGINHRATTKKKVSSVIAGVCKLL